MVQTMDTRLTGPTNEMTALTPILGSPIDHVIAAIFRIPNGLQQPKPKRTRKKSKKVCFVRERPLLETCEGSRLRVKNGDCILLREGGDSLPSMMEK